MNARHQITSLRSILILVALLTPASSARTLADTATLPEGIEATGDAVEVSALRAWADRHRQIDPEQAKRTVRRALALARELNEQREIGESLILLGNISFPSNPALAESYYLEAQEALEAAGDEHALIRNLIHFGNIRKQQGALREALTYYFDALEGFENLGDTEGKVKTLNNIGVAYEDNGDLGEALKYYERAAALAETLETRGLLAYTLNSVGAILLKQGSYERAEIHLRRAISISEEYGSSHATAIISNNLGYLNNEQGRYQQALPLLLTAERLAEELVEKGLLMAVHDEIGKAYLGLGLFDDALRYAHESLASAQEADEASRQMDAHRTLSRIYEAVGDPVQALAHFRAHAAAKDSVFNTEKAGIIAEMQTRYETREKLRAIERLEQENQIQTLRQALLLGGIVVALLTAGLFYNRYRLKQKANHLLEELDVAKSRFFVNISHEFRTPLTIILGGLNDALAGRFGTLSPKLAEQNRAMLGNTRRLQQLVDQVLDLNRLESGKLELLSAPGNVVQSLQQLVDADMPLAERNGIKLTFEHDVESCPRDYDEEKLEKIVGNLLSNALKFTPEGGTVAVKLRCGDDIEITVSDDGPGIPETAQEKVFERFVQLDGEMLHDGTGIGLALAKELAELHGGKLVLESERKAGSAFTVRLPLNDAVLDESSTPFPAGNPEIDSAIHSPRQPAAAEGDRTTVLVIEDNADVRAYVRRSMEAAYRVLDAADGESGLQCAREILPDLIVSDLMLPGIDGYEVARRLKAGPATECIPLIMLTARTSEKDKIEGYGSGAEVYITKPFSPQTLQAAGARLLEERHRLRRRLREETQRETQAGTRNDQLTLSARARAAVLENLHDEQFSIEELAAALNMTRHTLYNRLKSEIDLPPSDFVRTLRLERARELLADGAGSVSEVAYAVGFNSLATFSRAYRTHYGTPPSSHLSGQNTNPGAPKRDVCASG